MSASEAYRDCEWYWGARYAAIGHHAQCIENSGGGGAPDSGASLERLSEIADRGNIPRVRRIERVLVHLPYATVLDLQYAFEPFGIERTWLTLRKAFTKGGLNLLQIAERSREAHAECRAAYNLTDADAPLEPIMVREWFASLLRSHYKSHTTEPPRSSVVPRMANCASERLRSCLDAYENASDDAVRARLSGAA